MEQVQQPTKQPAIQLSHQQKIIDFFMKQLNSKETVSESVLQPSSPNRQNKNSIDPVAVQRKKFIAFWERIAEIYQIQNNIERQLMPYNENIIIQLLKYLTVLPYNTSTIFIIRKLIKKYDPNRSFFKKLFSPFVESLEGAIVDLNSLTICLSTLNQLFKNQTPTNPHLDSYIELKGGKGFKLQKKIKWPFHKGGTIVLWFNIFEQTKQCRLFGIQNKDKGGMQIILKNGKIYFQKMQEENRFRLMKSKSAYLCEAVYNQHSKLSLEFEVKKRFFPYFSINVITNNFVINNIEVDLPSFNCNDFTVELFRNFHGLVYSGLILTSNLASQVQQLNNVKGFSYENDIRNFTYIFESDYKQILLVYSAIRAMTINEKQKKLTYLFDAINRNNAIAQQGQVFRNIIIKKDIANYGSLKSYVPFLYLLSKCPDKEQQSYTVALNLFLQLLKNIFMNKSQSIEQAYQIGIFRIIAKFFNKTQMKGFTGEILCSLRQIYISLNTRMMREQFFQEVVWGIKAYEFLKDQIFLQYISFVRGFYIEDIQSALKIFGIKRILMYLHCKFENSKCCQYHDSKVSKTKKSVKIQIQGYISIIQTILLLKRNGQQLDKHIAETSKVFAMTLVGCMLDSFVDFFLDLKEKDPYIFDVFVQVAHNKAKLPLCVGLAYCFSQKSKLKLTQLILTIYGNQWVKQSFKDRQLYMLCLRSQSISNLQSIFNQKSSLRSQQNIESTQQSQDRMSMNSITIRKYMVVQTINPDEDKNQKFGDQSLVDLLIKWTFDQKLMENITQDNESPGVYLLMQLYKCSNYRLRFLICENLLQNSSYLHLTPDFLAWSIECLLLAEYDHQQAQASSKSKPETVSLISKTKNLLIQIQSNYRTYESSEQTQLSIIKLVLASVCEKYKQQNVSKVSNKVYLQICYKFIENYQNALTRQMLLQVNLSENKIVYLIFQKFFFNVYTILIRYLNMRRDEDLMDFEQDQIEAIEIQSEIVLQLIEKIADTIYNLYEKQSWSDMLKAKYTPKHEILLNWLFNTKKQTSIFCLIIVILQTLFEGFEDLNITNRKRAIQALRKYLILLVVMCENSGEYSLEDSLKEIQSIFINTLSFLENKFFQYYNYPFERHKNLGYAVENKIRKNIEDMKKEILEVFLQLIRTIKYIHETSSMEHKSFYELMRKRKSNSKSSLKNFFPVFWRAADQRIIQFLSLTNSTLVQAKQKLQLHLLQKKLSTYSSDIEKKLTKKIEAFIETQMKKHEGNERNSVHYYMKNQTEKCKIYTDWEQQLSLMRFEVAQRMRQDEKRIRQSQEKVRRETQEQMKNVENYNRVYEGLWANKNFYQFSQRNQLSFDKKQQLNDLYEKVRSTHTSKYYEMPIINIKAKPNSKIIINSSLNSSNQQIFIQDHDEDYQHQKPVQAPQIKSGKYFKLGLRFLKQKVIEKIMKSPANIVLPAHMQEQQDQLSMTSKLINFMNIIWVQPMKVCQGDIKIIDDQLLFYVQPWKQVQHLSLIKPNEQDQFLLQMHWSLKKLQNYRLVRYLLKQNAVQIKFKGQPPVLLSFYLKGDKDTSFQHFIKLLDSFINPNQQQKSSKLLLLKRKQNHKQKLNQMTLKWKTGQLSNFKYLMFLNIFSGRTICDLNQYFVFPWVYTNYQSTKFKKQVQKYRDFSKMMGAMGSEERTKKFVETYKSSQQHLDDFPEPHFYGFHYLNIGIILQYLIRIQPYTYGAKALQGGKFDLPDRLFCSIPQSYKNASSQVSDIRELIPQFFYFPQFLINDSNHDFGYQQQSTTKVDNVQLPQGCTNSYNFIQYHRQALQSPEVTANINKWIDLIFGYKQQGKQAQANLNKFHYLTYDSNHIYIPPIQDQIVHSQSNITFTREKQKQKRLSIESQIAFFGKTPSQIFTKPHPQQKSTKILQHQLKCKRFSLNFQKKKQQQQKQQKSQQPIQYPKTEKKSGKETIFVSFSQINNNYMLLRKDGTGIVYSIDNEKQGLKIEKQFQMEIYKFQNIYLLDQRFHSIEENQQQELSTTETSNEEILTFNKPDQPLPISCIFSQTIIIGGLWGGKILKYNIIKDKAELYGKHSQTVTAICSSDELQLIVSGSLNGQVIIWQFSEHNKLLFKKKMAYHTQKINNLTIHDQLNIAISCGQDKLLILMSLDKYQIIRSIIMQQQILKVHLLSNPYYMFFIQCKDNSQYCYSINGQYLQSSSYQNLKDSLCINYGICGKFEQRIVSRIENELVWIKLPDFDIQKKYQLSQQDLQFTNMIQHDNIITFVSGEEIVLLECQKQVEIVQNINNLIDPIQKNLLDIFAP